MPKKVRRKRGNKTTSTTTNSNAPSSASVYVHNPNSNGSPNILSSHSVLLNSKEDAKQLVKKQKKYSELLSKPDFAFVSKLINVLQHNDNIGSNNNNNAGKVELQLDDGGLDFASLDMFFNIFFKNYTHQVVDDSSKHSSFSILSTLSNMLSTTKTEKVVVKLTDESAALDIIDCVCYYCEHAITSSFWNNPALYLALSNFFQEIQTLVSKKKQKTYTRFIERVEPTIINAIINAPDKFYIVDIGNNMKKLSKGKIRTFATATVKRLYNQLKGNIISQMILVRWKKLLLARVDWLELCKEFENDRRHLLQVLLCYLCSTSNYHSFNVADLKYNLNTIKSCLTIEEFKKLVLLAKANYPALLESIIRDKFTYFATSSIFTELLIACRYEKGQSTVDYGTSLAEIYNAIEPSSQSKYVIGILITATSIDHDVITQFCGYFENQGTMLRGITASIIATLVGRDKTVNAKHLLHTNASIAVWLGPFLQSNITQKDLSKLLQQKADSAAMLYLIFWLLGARKQYQARMRYLFYCCGTTDYDSRPIRKIFTKIKNFVKQQQQNLEYFKFTGDNGALLVTDNEVKEISYFINKESRYSVEFGLKSAGEFLERFVGTDEIKNFATSMDIVAVFLRELLRIIIKKTSFRQWTIHNFGKLTPTQEECILYAFSIDSTSKSVATFFTPISFPRSLQALNKFSQLEANNKKTYTEFANNVATSKISKVGIETLLEKGNDLFFTYINQSKEALRAKLQVYENESLQLKSYCNLLNIMKKFNVENISALAKEARQFLLQAQEGTANLCEVQVNNARYIEEISLKVSQELKSNQLINNLQNFKQILCSQIVETFINKSKRKESKLENKTFVKLVVGSIKSLKKQIETDSTYCIKSLTREPISLPTTLNWEDEKLALKSMQISDSDITRFCSWLQFRAVLSALRLIKARLPKIVDMDLKALEKIPLSQVTKELAQIKEKCGGTVSFTRAAKKVLDKKFEDNKRLFEFIEEKTKGIEDFDKHVEIAITPNLQGKDYNRNLLDNFIVAQKDLMPFIQATNGSISLGEFCKKIGTLDDKKLKYLETVRSSDSLSALKEIWDQVNVSVKGLEQLHKSFEASGMVSIQQNINQVQTMRIVYDDEETKEVKIMPETELQQRTNKALLQAESGPQIIQFSAKAVVLLKLSNMLKKLASLPHPCFVNFELNIKYASNFDKLTSISNTLPTLLNEIQALQAEYFNLYPMLTVISIQQMLHIFHLLLRSNADIREVNSDCIFSDLMYSLFARIMDDKLASVLKLNDLAKFEPLTVDNWSNELIRSNAITIFTVVGKLLAALSPKVNILNQPLESANLMKHYCFYDISNLTKKDRLTFLCSLLQKPPNVITSHSLDFDTSKQLNFRQTFWNVLFCNQTTTEGQVCSFLEKHRTMIAGRSIVFNLQSLPISLCDLVTQFVLQTQVSLVKQLCILFSTSDEIDDAFASSIDAFSKESINTVKPCVIEPIFNSIQAVSGPVGSGKTYFINNLVDSKRNGNGKKEEGEPAAAVYFAVNKSFTRSALIATLRKEITSHTHGTIYFNISPDAASMLLNDVLLELFAFGIIYDRAKGNLYYVNHEVTSRGWDVIFELPAMCANEADFYAHIPVLALTETLPHKILPATIPVEGNGFKNYAINEKALLVCKYLQAYKTGDIKRLYDDVMPCCWDHLEISELECREILYYVCSLPFCAHIPKTMLCLTNLINCMHVIVNRMLNNFSVTYNTSCNFMAQLILEQKLKETAALITNVSNDYKLIFTTDKLQLLPCTDATTDLQLENKCVQLHATTTSGSYANSQTVIQRNHLKKRWKLIEYLALSLGIDSCRVVEVLDKRKYVLTVNFCKKIIELHERLESGLGAIMEGETGVGKTEAAIVYSMLTNSPPVTTNRLTNFITFLHQCKELKSIPVGDSTEDFSTKAYDAKNLFSPITSRFNALMEYEAVADNYKGSTKVKKKIIALLEEFVKMMLLDNADIAQKLDVQLMSLKDVSIDSITITSLCDIISTFYTEDLGNSSIRHLRVVLENKLRMLIKLSILPLISDDNDKQKVVDALEKNPILDAIRDVLCEPSGVALVLVRDYISTVLGNNPILSLKHKKKSHKHKKKKRNKDTFSMKNFLRLTNEQLTVENTFEAVTTFFKLRQKKLFYKVLMHAKMTSYDMLKQLKPMLALATECYAIYRDDIKFTVFIDELNTSSFLGTLKQIIQDNFWPEYGAQMPSNIIWLGAINPSGTDRYNVKQLPPSLCQLVYQWPGLQDDANIPEHSELREYIVNLIRTDDIMFTLRMQHIQEKLVSLLIHAHRETERTCTVSQREIQRVFKLFNFFWSKLLENSDSDIQVKIVKKWILAIAMTYYFRLPEQQGNAFPRERFNEVISKQLQIHGDGQLGKFEDLLTAHISFIVDSLQIPAGIHKNQALRENIYCTIVCSESKIPLIIQGAPGCSKSLSVKVVSYNMNGVTSFSPILQQLHKLDVFVYHGSKQSSSLEIQEVFESAFDRQKTYDANNSNKRCLVLFEEAGIPDKKEESLKVLHYYLANPSVSAILLTNTRLDDAKSNRAIELCRSQPIERDLAELAKKCFCTKINDHLSDLNTKLLEQFSKTYIQLTEDGTLPKWIGLRDFYHFVRYLRRHANSDLEITHSILLRAIERNFNGLSSSIFKQVARRFCLAAAGISQQFLEPEEGEFRLNLEVLRSSLSDRYREGTNMNDTSVRFKLLLDPSKDDAAIYLLFESGVVDKSNIEIFNLSSFEDDDNNIFRVEVISRIILAMEQGKTILMLNTDEIHGSFYDLFNQYYRSTIINNEHQYYATIAVGSVSHSYKVHPEFQCIVHMRESAIKRTPTAFMNRFEKYRISLSDALLYIMRVRQPSLEEDYMQLKERATEFVKFIGGGEHCAGFDKHSTIDSIILQHCLQRKDANGSSSIFCEDLPLVAEVNEQDKLMKSLREIICKLLQISIPESVICNKLPPAFMDSYIRQYHMHTPSFISRLLERTTAAKVKIAKVVAYSPVNSAFSYLPYNSEKYIGDPAVVEVCKLNKFRSSSQLSDSLQQFSVGTKSVYVLVTDISSCNISKITYIRQHIDEIAATYAAAQPKVFLILCHYRFQQLNNRFSSSFLYGWEHFYVDGSHMVTDFDLQQFVATTFKKVEDNKDLSTEEQYDDQFGPLLENKLLKLLSQELLRLKINTLCSNGTPTLSEECDKFYNAELKSQMFPILQQLFDLSPAIFNSCVMALRKCFSFQANYNELKNNAQSVLELKPVNLRQKMATFLNGGTCIFALKLLILLVGKWNLQTLFDNLKSTSKEAYESLICTILETCCVKSLKELSLRYESLQVISITENRVNLVAFSNLIQERVTVMLQALVEKTNNTDDFHKLIASLTADLYSDDMLGSVIQTIDSSQVVLQNYTKDCIFSSLLLQRGYSREVSEQLCCVIESCLRAVGTDYTNSVASVHVLLRFRKAQLIPTVVTLLPLFEYQPVAASEIEDLRDVIDAVIFKEDIQNEMLNWIVQRLWVSLSNSSDFKLWSAMFNSMFVLKHMPSILQSILDIDLKKQLVTMVLISNIIKHSTADHANSKKDIVATVMNQCLASTVSWHTLNYEKVVLPLLQLIPAESMDKIRGCLADIVKILILLYVEHNLELQSAVPAHEATKLDVTQLIPALNILNDTAKLPCFLYPAMKLRLLNQIIQDSKVLKASSQLIESLVQLLAQNGAAVGNSLQYLPPYMREYCAKLPQIVCQPLLDAFFSMKYKELGNELAKVGAEKLRAVNAKYNLICTTDRFDEVSDSAASALLRGLYLLHLVEKSAIATHLINFAAEEFVSRRTQLFLNTNVLLDARTSLLKNVNGLLKDNKAYQLQFLSAILRTCNNNSNNFNEFMLRTDVADIPCLQAWREIVTIVANPGDFSFMNEAATNTGKVYQEVKVIFAEIADQNEAGDSSATKKFVEYCKKTVTRYTNAKYDLRMMLVILGSNVFLQYKQSLVDATAFLNSLRTCLELTDAEIKLLGCIFDYTQIAIHEHEQSVKVLLGETAKSSTRSAVINCIAAVFGMPPNSTHLHTNLLHMPQLVNTYAPGCSDGPMRSISSAHHGVMDCYTQMSETGKPHNNINKGIGENAAYLLYFQSFWMLLASVMAFPENIKILQQDLFSNTARKCAYGKATDVSTIVRNFVLERASVNWNWIPSKLELSEEQAERLVVLYLEELRCRVFASPAKFKPTFTSLQAQFAYEQELKQIFSKVTAEKANLSPSVKQEGSCIYQVLEYQRKEPPTLTLDIASGLLASYSANINEKAEEDEPQRNELAIITSYIDEKNKIDRLQVLPYCYDLYAWVATTYSGLLKQSDLDKPVIHFIRRYQQIDKQTATHMETLLNKAVHGWNDYVNNCELRVGPCGASQAIEIQLDAQQTPLRFFVSINDSSSSTATHDHVHKASNDTNLFTGITFLAQHHNSLASTIARHLAQLQFISKERTTKFPLALLRSSSSGIIFEKDDDFYEVFESYFEKRDGGTQKLQFAFEALQSEIVTNNLLFKLELNTDGALQQFRLRKEESSITNLETNFITDIQQQYSVELNKQKQLQLQAMTHHFDLPTVSTAIFLLSCLATELQSTTVESTIPISELIAKFNLENKETVQHFNCFDAFPVCYLKAVTQYLIQKKDSGECLFSHLPQQAKQPIPTTVRQQIEQYIFVKHSNEKDLLYQLEMLEDNKQTIMAYEDEIIKMQYEKQSMRAVTDLVDDSISRDLLPLEVYGCHYMQFVILLLKGLSFLQQQRNEIRAANETAKQWTDFDDIAVDAAAPQATIVDGEAEWFEVAASSSTSADTSSNSNADIDSKIQDFVLDGTSYQFVTANKVMEATTSFIFVSQNTNKEYELTPDEYSNIINGIADDYVLDSDGEEELILSDAEEAPPTLSSPYAEQQLSNNGKDEEELEEMSYGNNNISTNSNTEHSQPASSTPNDSSSSNSSANNTGTLPSASSIGSTLTSLLDTTTTTTKTGAPSTLSMSSSTNSALEDWDVGNWLRSLKLEKYLDSFVDNGFDDIELVHELNAEDLDDLGVTIKGHRKKLLMKAKLLL